MLVAAMATMLLVVPVGAASAADHCAPIQGTAVFDFGNNVGYANVAYDGERLRVPFFSIGFTPTGEFTADIEFLFFFPQDVVYVVEHSVTTPKGGPAGEFNSTLDVFGGEVSQWTWSGTANLASQRAAISRLSGELCFAP
jgi:hypothetical protein